MSMFKGQGANTSLQSAVQLADCLLSDKIKDGGLTSLLERNSEKESNSLLRDFERRMFSKAGPKVL